MRGSLPTLKELIALWLMWRNVARIRHDDVLVMGCEEERGNESQALGLGR